MQSGPRNAGTWAYCEMSSRGGKSAGKLRKERVERFSIIDKNDRIKHMGRSIAWPRVGVFSVSFCWFDAICATIIVFSAIFDLYWPKLRMVASNNIFAESHKRTLTFVFTLQIVDTVNF